MPRVPKAAIDAMAVVLRTFDDGEWDDITEEYRDIYRAEVKWQLLALREAGLSVVLA